MEKRDQIPMYHQPPSEHPKDFHRKKGTKEQRSKSGALRTIAKPSPNEAPK